VVWLPTWGSPAFGDVAAQRVAAAHGHIQYNAATWGGVQIPLTFDLPPESAVAAGTAESLADYELAAWRLERFVGKLHLKCLESRFTVVQDQNVIYEPLFVAASLIVRRVDSAGNALASTNFDTVNNQLAQNIRDPFVWRRTWVLEEGKTYVNLDANESQERSSWPETNSAYGSVMDGPHIDTKSKRFIGPEERLFFEITTAPVNWDADPNGASVFSADTYYVLDYRMVGNPAKASNRRNASR